MSQMKELFEKVAKNTELQDRFNQIRLNQEKLGPEETKQQLLAFSKDTGFDISLEEMQTFFLSLQQGQTGELSDLELDMVAGGKSDAGWLAVATTIFTWAGCAIVSAVVELEKQGGCGESFQ